MKKSIRKSLVGILAFLTFAGLGFAQEKVAKPYFEIYGVDGAITEDNPAVSIPDITDNDISIKCTTEGVTIWYTLDGSDPSLAADGTPEGTTTQLNPPTKSFYVNDYYENPGDHLTIKAMATKEGMTQSDIISASFYKQGEAPTTPEEKPASPTFNPASGEIIAGETITIASTTADAEIFYAFNAEETFVKYENPVALNDAGSVTLKAYAKKGEAQSETATTTYTVKAPAPQPTITFNPASGSTVKEGDLITITAENNDEYNTIYYQTGTSIESIPNFTYDDPNTLNYNNPIAITADAPVIKVALIVGEEGMDYIYKYFTATYTVKGEPTVTFSPASGSTVEAGDLITITAKNNDEYSTIYYQTGTSIESIPNFTYDDPNTLNYNNSIAITADAPVIKVALIVGEEGMDFIYKYFTATYTVKGEPTVTFSPASGSTVEAGDLITLTAENFGDYETIYYMTGSSAASIPNFTIDDCHTYTKPIAITAAEPVIKAALIVGEEGYDYLYKYFTASYTVNEPAPVKPEKPIISPNGGNVLVNTPVVIAKGDADSIFWKTGNNASEAYTKSLEDATVVIKTNTVLRAFAMKDGVCSDTATATYKVLNVPVDPEKASILLVVDGTNCPHTDRNQYQILLDSNHSIANDFKSDLEGAYFSESILSRLYNEHTFTVPTGITAANATTSGINPDEQATLFVEPGTYDIFMLQSYDAFWLGKNILRGIERMYNGIEGDRKFSLDNISLKAGKAYVFNITFDAGGAHGELMLPLDLELGGIMGEDKPSCELDSVTITLSINNLGSTAVSEYMAYCTNGTDTIKETVSTGIGAGTSAVYTFGKKLKLKDGENTVIKAGIIVENEDETANNTGEYLVFHSSASELPLAIDPAKMLSAYAGDWSIDEENNALVASLNASTPIFSSCFHAEEAGKYRLSYGYICGRYVEMPDGTVLVNNKDVYEVRVGKTSLPYESWKVVAADSTITGSSNYSEFTPKDIVFDITESGDYAFCIIPKRVNDQDNLKFRGMTVEMMQAAAARINSFTVNSPRIVPQDWGTANYATNVVVENRGLEKLENATLSFKVNGEEATKETFSLNLNETKTLTVNVPVQGFKKGDKMKFSGELLAGTLSMAKANAVPAEITVSENTAAFDYVTDFIAVQGMQSYADALVGLIFPVVEKDTLTAISCGWATEEEMLIGLSVHKVSFEDEQVVMGETFYNEQVRRGGSGLNTYDLPALLLEPGYYFIAVEQLGLSNFGLAVDESPEGGIHVYDKAEKEWKYITNGGYPVVRAVFGSNGVLLNKDAAITAISKPIAGGIFAENEPIVVSVRNNSYKAAEIPVHVLVDNAALESKTVSVEPYHTAEVSFTANLAATNQNRNITLTAFTALSGDEVPANDTLTKQVLSMVPADPYRMDFESCLDFATEGLNPAWTSVSLDNSPVMPLRHVLEDYTFQYIEFPGHETDLGFIAFNPLNTEPSMVLFDYYDACRSHSGQRFGVSLGITDENASKNDWLISPKLKMPSKNTQLSMWVKSFDRVYKESYEIWVSEGSNDPTSGDFICLYPGEDEEALIAPAEWTQAVFSLSQYNGKEIHVAIRCNSADAPMFMIDDIVIGENADNEETQAADFRLSVYPNPVREMVSLLSPDAAIKSVSIFNLSGTLVHRSANHLNTNNYRYNASGLTAGMYFVRVETERGTAIRKFVIQ